MIEPTNKTDSLSATESKYFKPNENRLRNEYFDKNCVELATSLLGKLLCRKVDATILKGKIVETEAYLGKDDGASHSFQGRRTTRNEAMFLDPGTAYVYKIYGMYHCFNISSKEEGSAVLIRALEPVAGQDLMKEKRSKRRKDGGSKLKGRDYCNGPSKLCDALNITKEEINCQDLTISNTIWLEDYETVLPTDIATTPRVGIDGSGKKWADLPLRFYVQKNQYVSKTPKRKT